MNSGTFKGRVSAPRTACPLGNRQAQLGSCTKTNKKHSNTISAAGNCNVPCRDFVATLVHVSLFYNTESLFGLYGVLLEDIGV